MPTGAEFHFMLVRQMVFHAARCVACHGVRSHPVPVAVVGECSIPVVKKVARGALQLPKPGIVSGDA